MPPFGTNSSLRENTWSPAVTSPFVPVPSHDAMAVAVADFDGDGRPDLLLRDDPLTVDTLRHGDSTTFAECRWASAGRAREAHRSSSAE